MNLTTLEAVFSAVLSAIGAVLRGQWNIIEQLQADRLGLLVAVIIVLLAGLSEALGQSIVLFANRVRPLRFVASLIVQAVLFLGGYIAWVTSIWLIGQALFNRTVPYMDVMRAVGLAYVPLVFGFMALLPYLGSPIIRFLYLWVLIAMVYTVRSVLDLTIAQTVICAGFGVLLVAAMRATLGKPIVDFGRRLLFVVAGTRIQFNWHDLISAFDDDMVGERTNKSDERTLR
jgi:GAF domain-containing protein